MSGFDNPNAPYSPGVQPAEVQLTVTSGSPTVGNWPQHVYTVTGVTALVPGDLQLVNATAGVLAPVLPLAANCGKAPAITVMKQDSVAHTVTVTAGGSDKINQTANWGATTVALATQGNSATFMSDGVSNWYVIATS